MDNTSDQLICVDIYDHPVGCCGKLEAHKKSILHRAFSIFLVDPRGQRMLIQQRALGKYHSGGLWANTCCSHPRVGERTEVAARRRLQEEVGISCDLQELGSFVYRQTYEDGLVEYEYDHIFLGYYQGESPDWQADPEEIQALAWIGLDQLAYELRGQPEKYAAWFLIAAPQVLQYLRTINLKMV